MPTIVRRPPMPTINRSVRRSGFGNSAAKFTSRSKMPRSPLEKNRARMLKAIQKRQAFKRASVQADQPVKAALEKRGAMLAGEIGRLQARQTQE